MPVYDRIQLAKVLKEAAGNQASPVYLLWGERYLYQSAYEGLVSALLPEKYHSTNLRVMEGESENIYRLVEELKTFPFFPGRQVIVVKDTRLFHSRATAESLLAKSYQHFTKNNLRAAAGTLMEAMALSGLAVEDVREGGWERMAEATWEKMVGEPKSDRNIRWLTMVTDFAIQAGMHEWDFQQGEAAVLEEALARGIPDANHLILLTDTVDKRKSLYRMIEEKGVVISFEIAGGGASAVKRTQDKVLRDLIKDILSQHGKTIESEAASELMERIGFNPGSVAAAVEKVTNYVGERKTITAKDVDIVVRSEKEEPVYELTGAFGQKDIGLALIYLNCLLDQRFAPLQILAALTNQVRRLLLARWALDAGLGSLELKSLEYRNFQQVLPVLKKEGKIPRGLEKISPYPLFLLFKQARGFSIDHLIQCMSEMLRVDIALKSGAGEPRLLLEDAIFKCLAFGLDTVIEAPRPPLADGELQFSNI